VRCVRYNERKRQCLEIFATHGSGIRPTEWAIEARFYPSRAAYPYLKRLHRWGYLARRRDFRGRILYRLAPRGAYWLLNHKR
jgi:DNA-binding PadR family transcriptional regulator